MFPQVSPSLFALDFASLTTIAFCAPFVFMVLRIAFPATPLDSHLYKLPGGCGGQAGKTVGRVCAMDTNKPAFINLQTLYRCEKGFLVRFQSNRNPLGKTPRGGVPPPLANVPNLAPSQASKSVQRLASCPLPGWVP